MHILVTGATGYVGGRLVPRLLKRGHQVRILVRDRTRVLDRPWAEDVEIIEGDVLDADTLPPAVQGVEVAYYLIHSMYAGEDYAERDRQAADIFGRAAAEAGVQRVVYLGAIEPEGDSSEHLHSRLETGAGLAEHVPVLEVRAGPVIGSGSASFEMCRYLTERLPVMVTPRWIDVPVRPVAIRTVLHTLVAALDVDATGPVDIGAEPTTFRDMMRIYAEVRGLRKRLILPTPLLAPGLAARWVGLVTPITNDLAVPLVKGMTAPVVGDTTRAGELFPEVEPISYRRAVELALDRLMEHRVETRWSGALPRGVPYTLSDREGLIREQHVRELPVSPDVAFEAVLGLGGENGWGAWDWAWRLRGRMDQWVGGPGTRRGRRDPDQLLAGEVLDFWRVEAIDPPNHLLLRAEMRVPGKAWLEFVVEPWSTGSRVVQTALYQPRGLRGLAYWWAMYPMHLFVFASLLDAIEARAVGRVDASAPGRVEAVTP